MTIKELCPDIDRWPESWEGVAEDTAYGREIVKEMKPFIDYLIENGLSKRGIKRHIDNLWILGGELIRDLNYDESLRQKAALDLILDNVDEDGGPYCRHLDAEEQTRCFDATCKKFYRFLRGRQVGLK